MPIYEYRCLECGEVFSELRMAHKIDEETKCPDCGSGSVKKKVSSFSSFSGGSFSGGGGFRPGGGGG